MINAKKKALADFLQEPLIFNFFATPSFYFSLFFTFFQR